MRRVIWQYWETKTHKPPFVDELRDIANNNANVEIIVVTPDNLDHYLPNIPKDILEIDELAHKADMIRSLLISQYGGMWLDSDAIVLTDLNWLFDLLEDYEFIGFNNSGSFSDNPLNVRINCFLARPDSIIMKQWVVAQHAKFPRKVYEWTEIGTQLLDPIVKQHRKSAKLLNFDIVCPIPWDQVEKFSSIWVDSQKILESTHIVMLSNKSLEKRKPKLTKVSLYEHTNDNTLIADIINKAIDSSFTPKIRILKVISQLVLLLRGKI